MMCGCRANFSAVIPSLSGAALIEEVERYWAAPSGMQHSPAPHATGAATDLTLRWKDGEQLWMGSLFDDVTPLAHRDRFEHLRSGEFLFLRSGSARQSPPAALADGGRRLCRPSRRMVALLLGRPDVGGAERMQPKPITAWRLFQDWPRRRSRSSINRPVLFKDRSKRTIPFRTRRMLFIISDARQMEVVQPLAGARQPAALHRSARAPWPIAACAWPGRYGRGIRSRRGTWARRATTGLPIMA